MFTRSSTLKSLSARFGRSGSRGPRQLPVAALMLGLVAVLGANDARANLDLVFLLDTTGSMGRELAEARTRVKEIVGALKAARPGETIRTGVVAYRDRGDEYVTRTNSLTDNVSETNAFLDQLRPNGGGDSPEDVVSGLVAALGLNWNEDNRTERQIFLVADAEAHLDYDDAPSLDSLLATAAKRRIVINAIGCRSLSARGVASFRKIALQTEGQFQHIGRVRMQGTRSLTAAIVAAAGADATFVPLQDAEVTTTTRRPLPMKAKSHDVDEVTVALVVSKPSEDDAKKDTAHQACTAVASVPRGLSLAGPPKVAVTDDDNVRIRLKVAPGNISAMNFKLPRCVGPTAEINVEIGG